MEKKWTFNPERMIALRESKGLTQEQFAKTIKRIKQQISMWETGKHSPALESLIDICNTHGVVPGYFFTKSGNNNKQEDGTDNVA